MVKGFPFEVPQEYASLPQLKVGVGGMCCLLVGWLIDLIARLRGTISGVRPRHPPPLPKQHEA